MLSVVSNSENPEIQQILIQTIIGRVLSPDNGACPDNGGVQDPTNTQSYNRYSYCLNNPLRYTDPSGWLTLAAFNNAVDIANNRYARSGVYSWGPGTDDQGFYSSSDGDAYATGAAYNDCYDSWGYTQYPSGADVVKHSYYNGKTHYISKTTGWKCEAHDAVWYSLEARQKPLIESLSDPDVMKLQSEQDGFLRIWGSSFLYKAEFACLITPKGLITFKAGELGGDGFGGLTPRWEGKKCYVNFAGSEYRVIGSAHVHWDKSRQARDSKSNEAWADGDDAAAYRTFKAAIPLFVLGWDQVLYNVNYQPNKVRIPSDFNSVLDLLYGKKSIIKLLMHSH